MKENKMKNISQMRGLPDYERQRLERLKHNADFMATQGHGSLATQIYDKSQAFATSLDAVNRWKNKYFVSDEDEDEDKEYMPEHEGNEGQNGYGNIKGNTKEQLEVLESQQKEGGPNPTDPYYEVIKKPEHNGRVHLFGKGVTKTDLKKNTKKTDYIVPEEFVRSIQAALVHQLQVANPGLNLVLPEFSFACIPRDATSGDKSYESTGEQSSDGTPTLNQVLENHMD